jgi:hypothetical protein
MATSKRIRTGNAGRRGARRTASLALAVIASAGITACSDSAGPEAGPVTTEDLQEFEEQLDALDERLGVLEGDVTLPEDIDDGPAGAVPDVTADIFPGADAFVGQEVTVSAEVSEMFADDGTAFRIAGDTGEPLLVVATSPPENLDTGDTVRVTGSVLTVRQDTFEQAFGLAPDQVFEEPAAFFDGAEEQIGIAADEVELLPDEG